MKFIKGQKQDTSSLRGLFKTIVSPPLAARWSTDALSPHWDLNSLIYIESKLNQILKQRYKILGGDHKPPAKKTNYFGYKREVAS